MIRMRYRQNRDIVRCQSPAGAFSLIQRLRERYRKKFEEADALKGQLALTGKKHESAFCLAATPAAKVLQLYGLGEASASTRSIVEKTETFMKTRPVMGKLSEVLSWSVIGLGLAQAGAFASSMLSCLGPILADAIGYTAAMVHPSIVSLSMQRIQKRKCTPGMSEYFQASSVTEVLAAPVFFGVLGAIVHSGSPDSVSVGRGVAAALVSSLSAFTAWCIGFALYWAKVIRKDRGRGLLNGVKAFCRASIKPFKPEAAGAYDEAGRMAGTGFVVWAIPWYIVRVAAAAAAAMTGVQPEAFNRVFFSITASVEGIGMLFGGIKNTLVERIIERGNKEVIK